MSTEDNKAIVRRHIEEVWNQGKIAVFDELNAPNWIYHDSSRPDIHTLDDYKRYITEVRSVFPDIRFTIADMFAEGEQVVVRWVCHATNTGDLPSMNLPATGKQVTVTGISIFRFADGKGVEAWNEMNSLGMLRQLGVIPESGQAS
jgi:steroid delta-isomerase-like uncharacterized protein